MNQDLLAYLDTRADAYGVPREVARNLVQRESNWNPSAVSKAGAIGLGQLMPGTARDLGVDPYDPYQNLDGSMRYLGQNIKKYGLEGGLAAYNGGPGNWERRGRNLSAMAAETQQYVPAVLGASNMANIVDATAAMQAMGALPNSMNSFGISRGGSFKSKQIDPAIAAEMEQIREQKMAMLPYALAHSMSSNKGSQNFGQLMTALAMPAMDGTALKNGRVLPSGEYVTDDSSDLLNSMKQDSAALRNAQIQQIMDQRDEDNAPANVITDENGQKVVDPNAPWRGLRHKESMTMRNQTMNTANKELDEMRKAYAGDVATMQSLDKFGEYNRRNATGGLYDKLMPDWAHTGEHSAMIAEQNKLTPLQRPAGSGATSDFEQKMYKMGLPNIGNTGNTNAQIRLATQALIDVRAARLAHHEQYLAKYGHLNGAESDFAPQVKAIEAKYAPMISAYGSKSKAGQVSNAPQSALPKTKAAVNGGFSIEPAGE